MATAWLRMLPGNVFYIISLSKHGILQVILNPNNYYFFKPSANVTSASIAEVPFLHKFLNF